MWKNVHNTKCFQPQLKQKFLSNFVGHVGNRLNQHRLFDRISCSSIVKLQEGIQFAAVFGVNISNYSLICVILSVSLRRLRVDLSSNGKKEEYWMKRLQFFAGA